MPVGKPFFRRGFLSALFIAIFLCLLQSDLAQSGRVPTPEKGTTDSEPPPSPPPPQQQRILKPQQATTEQNNDKGPAIDPGDVVRVSTDLTNVLMTAVDKDKRFVTSLVKSDIQVSENGVPQEITTFERETDLPLSLCILVDVSASEEMTLPDEKAAARAFIQSVIRPTKDRVAVLSFTGDATVEQELTNRVLELERAIERIEIVLPNELTTIIGAGGQPIRIGGDSRAGSTAIWDAILSTSNELLSNTPEPSRRAIILLTDGEDTSSRVRRDDAILAAVKQNVAVYSIGIGGDIKRGVLKTVSDKTGGRSFVPHNEADLTSAFKQIEEELRSQYLVAYTPTNRVRDGSFRRIQIDVTNPEYKKSKLRLLYRDGYFARTAIRRAD